MLEPARKAPPPQAAQPLQAKAAHTYTMRRKGEHIDGQAEDAAKKVSDPGLLTQILQQYQDAMNGALNVFDISPLDLVDKPQLRDVVWAAVPFLAAYVLTHPDQVSQRARAMGLPVGGAR